MSVKAEWTITCEGKEYNLCKPSFDVLALAMQKYISGSGELNLVGAGKIVFDSCYTGGNLEEIQDDVSLYANLCLKSARVVEFKEADIKKN